MFQVIKQITFCYGHRLINYDGKCQHLHGHDAVAEIVLESEELDERGMVVDFSDIKADISAWIDDHMDHKMLLCERDPILEKLSELGEPIYPMQDNPTAENIAKEIYLAAQKMGYPVVEIRLWESSSSCATYAQAKK